MGWHFFKRVCVCYNIHKEGADGDLEHDDFACENYGQVPRDLIIVDI